MSNQKRKLIIEESDEETGDSDLNLSIPIEFLRPSSSVGPSHGRDILEYPRPLVVSPSLEVELVGNRGGHASGSSENNSFDGVGVPEGVDDGEGSSSGPSVPPQRRNLGHRVEADSYPIDYIACATTQTDLFKLRNLYNIPEEVLLVVHGKGDVLSRPPRRYVTMHLESFKLGARLPLQRYFAKILGGMHLAPGQLHPNGWRVFSAIFVLWERCGSEEPSLVEVKHLYQLRSSPREVGWYYFMSSSAKRKPITGFPSSYNWKNKFFFAGEVGVQQLIRWVELEDRPLLQVETALVNASTCQDLLSPTNLVGSGLVDIAVGMDNKILSALSRKRGRAPSSSSNPPPPPAKKTNVGPSKAHVPALPPHPPRKSGGEKTADKSSEVSTRSGDRSSPLSASDQGDYLTPYQRDYGKSVEPKMVQDIESMNLSELASSVQQATQSERDTLRTALEGEIRSLSEQLAEAKGKSADVDDRLDAEYNSGVAFSYKCIMSVLKEEYPKLDMRKLEAGVERYMAEAG
ncbi:uncharacterized protein LOC107175559 [Citrus sinensis]|uniref:uncharacterized protein LOC107175559 n=1 Tax=Citrus sinensis TaxID=2711 RepID=UPI00227818E3|nr:uncharacterized protein LOC107175559 [Citrus sinensis]